jgi:hypothetical protein
VAEEELFQINAVRTATEGEEVVEEEEVAEEEVEVEVEVEEEEEEDNYTQH